MLKFATKFALAVSLLGAMAAPTFAGPPKGMGGGSGGMSMKSGSSLGSSRNFSSNLGSSGLSSRSLNLNSGSSNQLSRSLNNNSILNKAPQSLGGSFKLAERSNGNPTLGIKPIGDIKNKPLNQGISLGNLGGNNSNRDLKPIKNLDQGLGLGGNKLHDLSKSLKPFKPMDPGFGLGGNKHDISKPNFESLKHFQNGMKFPGAQTFCGPNNNCGPKSGWGCGGWGGIFGGGFGCWSPGYGCGPYYPNWYYCSSWFNYCPSYSYCTPIYTTPIYTTPIVVNSAPIVTNTVGDVAAPAPVANVAAAPVANVAPAVPAAPAPATAATGIDLQVDGVALLETGDLAKNQGPLVLVTVSNKGTTPAGKFALGVYASLKEEPSKEMIPAGLMLEELAAGANRSIEVRMPVETLGMTAEGSTTKETFKQLFIVADVQNEVVESNKQNNILPVKREQLALKQ